VTNNSSDWWTIARKGGQKAADELPGVTLDFRMLGEGTAAAQKAVVDDLLAKGVDGIAIAPLDVENQKPMLDDAAAKTLLFTLGADAPLSKRRAYVGTADVDSGKVAATLVKEALPQGGKIVVFVGRRDAQNAVERLQGLREGLNGSQVEIVDVRTDDADPTKAKANVADTLVSRPAVVGFVGLWSYNGPAILNAVKDANKLGQIQIICFDEDEQTLQGVKDGHIFGTVVQQPFGFTYDAVRRMVLFLRGDSSQAPENSRLTFPTQVVKKDNVDQFWNELKKLRGR
jgi:ribose transport system substrate-binding protein